MTTRSGRSFKPSSQSATMSEDHSTSPPTAPTAGTIPPTASDVASIVDVMREMMRSREAERTHYVEENDKRFGAMAKQMELMERMLNDFSKKDDKETKRDKETMALTRLTDKDDIESYLTTFERMMTAYEVDAARWVYKLAPQLTGKAQEAYAALTPEEAQSYPSVKSAILRRYNINDETYRKRFRSLKLRSGQTPTEITT